MNVVAGMFPCDCFIALADAGGEVFLNLGVFREVGGDYGSRERVGVAVGEVNCNGIEVDGEVFLHGAEAEGEELKRSSVSPILLRSRVPWYAVPGASGFAGLKTSVRLSAHSASPFTAGVNAEEALCAGAIGGGCELGGEDHLERAVGGHRS
jgi:hypothetical protein